MKVAAQIFLNGTMVKTEDDAFGYSFTVVVVLGILGNILVILSILRQKKNMLKNNYYFLVLHLTICDLAALIIFVFFILDIFWLEEPLCDHYFMITCNIYVIGDAFNLTGVGMMLIISLLRYRANCASIKTCHQSTEFESRLWSGVPCWADCRICGRCAAMFFKVECRVRCLSEILLCILDVLRLCRSNNIHVSGLL